MNDKNISDRIEKNRNNKSLRDMDEIMAESDRIEPMADGLVKGKDGKSHTSYICPSCGNPVTRYANKFTCSACRQKLLWPGIDYSEYDARGAEMRQRRKEIEAQKKERKRERYQGKRYEERSGNKNG